MRFLSTLVAIGTIVAAFLLGRLLFSDRPGMATAVAGATALEPQFAYVNSLVNNDSLAFMAGAFVLLGCCGLAVASKEGSRIRFSVLTGCALGLALLTKEYAFTLLPLPWLALALTSASPKRRLIYLGCIANASILICGGWLVRNEVLYGQAWPFRAELANIKRLLPDTVWNGPAPSWYFSEIFPKEFFQSFWYSGGWGQIRLPLGLYGLLGVVAAVLAVGFLSAMVRWGGTWQNRKAVVILVAAILFDVAGAVYSNLAIHQPQGRYLLPAMPAVAVVLVVGLAGLLPSRAMRLGAIVVPTLLLVLSVYTLAFVVRPAYFG
jgi:4-amino-4-deoxy-L-arabinose transferase-like glycosyltransferase